MNCHLTHRFWATLWLTVALVALSAVLRDVGWTAAAVPLVLSMAFGLADGWWPPNPTVSVTIERPRTVEGDVVTAELTMTAPARVPWVEVELQVAEAMTALDPLRFTTSLVAGETFRRTIELRADRMGVTGFEWATVVSRDLLGFTERVSHLPLRPTLRVHPPTERLLGLLPLQRVRPVTGDHRSRHRGTGTELAEVRPHRHGDPARLVHPRISARRGQPMVLERHPDRSADAVLYVDSCQDYGVDLDTSLRWTVMAAIALSDRHGRAMDRIGVLDRGRGVRWMPPSLGRHALHDIVGALLSTSAALFADADDDDHDTARAGGEGAGTGHDDLGEESIPPHRLIPPGATVYAVSPLVSAQVLDELRQFRRRGHQVFVIEPQLPIDPTTSQRGRRIFRLELLERRAELAEVGIATIPWDTAESLEATLRRAIPTIRRLATATRVGSSQ